MAKTRRDPKGRALKKGETYKADRGLYCFAYTDPIGKRRFKYAKDLIELREREEELKRDSLDGLETYARGNSDLNFLFQRYIETKHALRSTTRTNYIGTYNRYVRDSIGKKKISDIKYSDVLYFYQTFIDRGYKVATVEGIQTILSPAFQMAVRDNILRTNPASGVMGEIKKNLKNRPEPRHALTPAEEKAFLDFIKQPEYYRCRPLFIFMFGTGCRVGEAIGIRWDDIKLDDGVVDINHDLTYYPREEHGFKCRYEIGDPKTFPSFRKIPLLPEVKEALLNERENQQKYGYRNLMELDGYSNFVFCNRFGGFRNAGSINDQIGRIVDKYNAQEEVKAAKEQREPLIIPKFSCHITRHTFCSRLCENGTNIKLIQQIMGHSDIRTTMNIYAEISKQTADAVFQDLNGDDIL